MPLSMIATRAERDGRASLAPPTVLSCHASFRNARPKRGRKQEFQARALRDAGIADVMFWVALAGCSARRAECRVASHTSEVQRRNAPVSAAINLESSVGTDVGANLFA